MRAPAPPRRADHAGAPFLAGIDSRRDPKRAQVHHPAGVGQRTAGQTLAAQAQVLALVDELQLGHAARLGDLGHPGTTERQGLVEEPVAGLGHTCHRRFDSAGNWPG